MSFRATGFRGAPEYVRSANFVNDFCTSVEITVTFGSGHTEPYTVAQGSNQEVERNIDHGSYSSVDPITSVKVTCDEYNQEVQEVLHAQAVERQEYVIGETNGGQMTLVKEKASLIPEDSGGSCHAPSYVQSADFANTTKTHAHIQVTFESKDVKEYMLQEGSNIRVEKEIDQGTFKTTDPITSVDVSDAMRNEGVHLVMQPQGIVRNFYVIGGENDGKLSVQQYVADTSKLMPITPYSGGAPQYVRSVNFVNMTNTHVDIKVTFQSNETEDLIVGQSSNKDVEKTIDHGSSQCVDPIESAVVSSEAFNGAVRSAMLAEAVERQVYVIEANNGNLNCLKFIPSN